MQTNTDNIRTFICNFTDHNFNAIPASNDGDFAEYHFPA